MRPAVSSARTSCDDLFSIQREWRAQYYRRLHEEHGHGKRSQPASSRHAPERSSAIPRAATSSGVEVLSLLKAVGTVDEEHNGKFKVTVGPETEVFERPQGKDIDVQMVVDLRRMLSSAGLARGRAGDGGRALARPRRQPVGQPHLAPTYCGCWRWGSCAADRAQGWRRHLFQPARARHHRRSL